MAGDLVDQFLIEKFISCFSINTRKKLVLLILCLTVVYISVAELVICNPGCEKFRYDYKLHVEEFGFFKYHDVPTPWDWARKHCQFQGAEIASPVTYDIRKHMTKYFKHLHPYGRVHTGFNSRYLPGDYVTVKGVRLYTTSHWWGRLEPNETGPLHNCLSMDTIGCLSIVEFSQLHAFVCYRKFTNLKPCLAMNSFGISDTDYGSKKFNHTYKFHFVPHTWEHAAAICFAEGGYLVIVNSKEEADHIKTIYDAKKSKIYPSASEPEMIHSGFHEDNVTGEWLTLFDLTLNESGYESWKSDFPTYSEAATEICGSLDPTGRLTNTNCNTDYHPFLCEMENNIELYNVTFQPNLSLNITE